jgi:four helix bundle protein
MNKPAQTYRDLLVWQKAIQAAKVIYEVTQAFPKTEVYGLTAQIRRSAVSVPSNIAEGFGRRAGGDFARFLHISRGALFELETQLLIAFEVSLLHNPDYTRLCALYDEIERMLESLIRRIRR